MLPYILIKKAVGVDFMDWHSLGALEVMERLGVNPDKGLSGAKVRTLEGKYGKNTLSEQKRQSILKRFFAQFSDFMVITLLVASAVSFVTEMFHNDGDYADPIIILVIVVINAIIGVTQESKAEKAIDSLKKLSAPHARVIRDSKQQNIASEDIVPGDILVLGTGDLVCADARIIDAQNLRVEEASLTGESTAVEKNQRLELPSDTPIAEQKNMLFATSSITSGHATAVAVETGMNTQVGKIANLINEGEAPQTPLQARLADTGKVLGIGIIIISIVIFVLGMLQHVEPLEMFMISISLAVAAIPEGLPAVVTIVLAIGVRRMAAKHAIIRKLPAVETLGSASVICSDKTGTLTQNKMTVVEIRSIDGKENMSSEASGELLEFCALCNNSELSGDIDSPCVTGEATENALLLKAAKYGKYKGNLEKHFKRIKEIPFESSRKLMTTVHSREGGGFRTITKGAPDVLLRLCTHYKSQAGVFPISSEIRRKIEKINESMAKKALRTLGAAYRDSEYIPQGSSAESGLIFCGLIGIIDPPRPEAKQAVRECLEAGIKPVMITGDHVLTATAIARELGMLSEGSRAMTGRELDLINQTELEKRIYDYSVFARVSPEHKVRIVKAFQSSGAVVAMTGDGVNDAPALKISDIGCAMGMSGTDVAKAASDMIMTDDNFSTIVEAVKQGRGIFENIKKTVHFLLSTNVGEIITVLMAFLLKMPSPLLAIQLLWINLVTDSFPALALGVEPVDGDIMKRKPNGVKKSLFSDGVGYNIVVEGSFIGAISLLAFTVGRVFFDIGKTPIIGRTMAFAVLGLCQLVHAFNVRSEESLFKIGIFGNKKMIYSFFLCSFLQVSVISIPRFNSIFKTQQLTVLQWLIVIVLSLSPLIISELEKLLVGIIGEKDRISNTKLKAKRLFGK